MERTCKKCGETKPIEEFGKEKRNISGYGCRCKSCDVLRSLEYYYKNHYYDKHKDRIFEYHRKYYENNKEKVNGYSKKYYQNNIKYIKKRTKEYRENNKEYYKEIGEKWRENNKEHISDYNKRYRQNKRSTIPDVYIRILLNRQYGLHAKILKQHPELIENYRQQIKIKRLLKQKKNENNETR